MHTCSNAIGTSAGWTVPEGLALKGSLAELAPGDTVDTCTVLTTGANETTAAVHNRMPVIVPRERFDPWLAGEKIPLDPCPADAIRIQPVSPLVNKASYDDPRCIEPLRLA